jgi:D-sedoheptulose 7-phosphate isomerase|tara:strand:+ start:6269 stop:6805 length:537 start_codon:yes stop_codon:yes gene_type:complete
MKNYYYKRFKAQIKILEKIDTKKLFKLEQIILDTSSKDGKIIIVGNGGSAATASHVAVDLSLNSKIKAINFNESDLITCFSNDFGYENWVKKSLEIYADPLDLLILISCSGNSKNLVNANLFAKKKGLKVATLTGCKKNNKLNSIKNSLNIWIDSKEYNTIEIVHHSILLNIVDGLKN